MGQHHEILNLMLMQERNIAAALWAVGKALLQVRYGRFQEIEVCSFDVDNKSFIHICAQANGAVELVGSHDQQVSAL